MQFIADICKSLNNLGYLTIDDLYTLSENEVIEKFRTCNEEVARAFSLFEKTKECFRSDKYCVNIKAKRRFVNPLVKTNSEAKRICDISNIGKECIDNYYKLPIDGFTYFDFYFKVLE